MTVQRDEATHQDEMAGMEIMRLQAQVEQMTEAHRNNENYLTHVLHQRNEAWNEGNRLNGRVAHLEQRL